MYKLQVVLVPPSLQATTPMQFGYGPTVAESSQLLPNRTSIAQSAGDASLQYANMRSASASFSPSYFNQSRFKKFLLFTKPTNTLLNLSDEIIDKCEKMYPSLQEDIEILSLQDNTGCDLDPDFLIKDVFNINNIVKVILRNEIDLDDSAPVSLYRSVKRSKMSNGSPRPVQPQQQISSSSGVLRIAKKRPPTSTTATSTIRSGTNGSMRISTPLARQIYPPPSSKMMSNNSDDEEEEDIGERSFLPPPTQPQSPPIRISSGIDTGKKIRSSAVEEDIVSRSETVDPDKSKQQRLLSGTPVMSTMTPNRVTLTGQRVVSEHAQKNELVFSASASSSSSFAAAAAVALTAYDSNKKPPATSPRITSGMLRIPEPRISEIEKELKEGPSSPASILPAKSAKIPMKKPYLENGDDYESDESSSSGTQETPETEPHSKASLQRSQSSIADNNGSPVKNSPLGDAMPHNVHLAELPKASSPANVKSSNGQLPTKQQQRKGSLETIVERKMRKDLAATAEPRRMNDFPDDSQGKEDGDSNEKNLQKENLPTVPHNKQPILASSKKPNGKVIPTHSPLVSKFTANGGATIDDALADDDDEEADTTVRIVHQDSDSSSFQKSELFKMIEGNGEDLPQWFKGKNSRKNSASSNNKNAKPYTTVLNKDIDNSKPDPRNILPQRTPRSAAKRAAQLLAGAKKNEVPEKATQDSSSAGSTDDESESGIETDVSSDDLTKRQSAPLANGGPKGDISLHSLKGSVVPLTDAKVNSKQDDGQIENKKSPQKIPEKKIEPVLKATETSKIPQSSVSDIKISEQMAKSFYPNSSKKQNERAKLPSKTTPPPALSSTGNTPSVATKANASPAQKVNNKIVKPKAKKEVTQPDNKNKEALTKAIDSKSTATSEAKDSSAKVDKKKVEAKELEKAPTNSLGAKNKNTPKEDEAPKSKQLKANKVEIQNEAKTANNTIKDKPKLAKPSANDKLKDLKAKFTNSKSFAPAGLVSTEKKDSVLSNEDSDSSGSSTEDESSSSSSSSSDGETSTSRKSRRVVVNTPREPVRSSSSKIDAVTPSLSQTKNATPNKVPVTQLMDMSSPPSAKSRTPSKPSSIFHDLPRKVRPSLSSLSDLVSRGIPDVKEKSSKSIGKPQPKVASSSDDESSPSSGSDSSSDSGSESGSDSNSGSDLDSDDSGDSSGDGKSFISAKSASAALGKKKKPSGGFASLIKDFKKK